jgi:hypothetical protein
VTIVDGPFFEHWKFFENTKFEANWTLNSKDGPDLFDIYCRQGRK